jgi:hypothetical protein
LPFIRAAAATYTRLFGALLLFKAIRGSSYQIMSPVYPAVERGRRLIEVTQHLGAAAHADVSLIVRSPVRTNPQDPNIRVHLRIEYVEHWIILVGNG